MGYLASVCKMVMNDKLSWMCKEVVVACFKISLHLPGWTEEDYKKSVRITSI
jgi:hypothetical protein